MYNKNGEINDHHIHEEEKSMDPKELQKQIRESKNSGEKIQKIFNEVSADLINNSYNLAAEISYARMLTFFRFVPYKYISKLYPQEFIIPIIDGLKFIRDNLGRYSNIREEDIKAFEDTRQKLLEMLNSIYSAGSDLNSLLDLYDQENVIRYSSELKPLYPSSHDFVEDTLDYLHGKLLQTEDSAEINRTIKNLFMLLPVGFVKNEFLSYVRNTLRDAVTDMPDAAIKEIHDKLLKLIWHTANPYYTALFNVALKYGLDKKPSSLTDSQLDKNIAKIGALMDRLDLAEEITNSILLMYDLITDKETGSHVDMNKYASLCDSIDSYLSGKRIKVDTEGMIDTDMLDRQINTVSLLSDKTDIFTKAGIEQSTLSAAALNGIMFAKYDSLYDELYSGLYNLFEYGGYDESAEPAEDVSVDDLVEKIAAAVEDELSHFPAFFRRERMRSIMNALPVGFNDMEEIHEYLHKSMDSIHNERQLYYIETIVASMENAQNDQQ